MPKNTNVRRTTGVQSIQEILTEIEVLGHHSPDVMVTLRHRLDESKWVQLLPDKINLSYPYDGEPAEKLAALDLPFSTNLRPEFWMPNLFADFKTAELDTAQLAEFVIAYMSKVFTSTDLSEFEISMDLAERGKIRADTESEFLRELVMLKRRLGIDFDRNSG